MKAKAIKARVRVHSDHASHAARRWLILLTPRGPDNLPLPPRHTSTVPSSLKRNGNCYEPASYGAFAAPARFLARTFPVLHPHLAEPVASTRRLILGIVLREATAATPPSLVPRGISFCEICRQKREPTSGLEPLPSPHYE